MAGTWLVKSDPGDYSFEGLLRDGSTTWDGVSNALALRHLREMEKGDAVGIRSGVTRCHTHARLHGGACRVPTQHRPLHGRDDRHRRDDGAGDLRATGRAGPDGRPAGDPGIAQLTEIGTGVASLVGVIVPEGARVAGHAIEDITIPHECVVAAVIRGSEFVVPRGDTRVEAEDHVAFVGPSAAVRRALDLFVAKERAG